MEYAEYIDEQAGAKISFSTFTPENEGGAVEYHLMLSPEKGESFEKQAIAIKSAYSSFLQEHELTEDNEFFARVFLSDAVNQVKDIKKVFDQKGNAFSMIEQTPLPDKKISAWIWLVGGGGSMKKYSPDGITTFRRGLQHIFTLSRTANFRDFSSNQTDFVFSRYTKRLTEQGMNLKDNVIRTWLFVRDIDNNYEGVVAARREFFKKHGLSKETHYISSTGIEGKSHDPDKLLIADIYAIKGIKQEQIKFLNAADNLNPTHEYGVTFERGTTIDYGDRKHVFISGTASIDNKGKIVAEGNVYEQCERTIKNIEALLKEAGADFSNIGQMIVYLRDSSDYEVINNYLKSNYKLPYIIVHAPVCRPGWLIEIECMAVMKSDNSDFKAF